MSRLTGNQATVNLSHACFLAAGFLLGHSATVVTIPGEIPAMQVGGALVVAATTLIAGQQRATRGAKDRTQPGAR